MRDEVRAEQSLGFTRAGAKRGLTRAASRRIARANTARRPPVARGAALVKTPGNAIEPGRAGFSRHATYASSDGAGFARDASSSRP
jgi:hypothetical protein